MLIMESASRFQEFAAQRQVSLDAPNAVDAVAQCWLAFYEQVRAADTTTEEGAWPDALLFEFGYRAALAGHYDACFYLNMTRQFTSQDGEDDDSLFQLTWQAEYEASPVLLALGRGTEWCNGLASLSEFRSAVLGSPALRAVAGLRATKVDYYLTAV